MPARAGLPEETLPNVPSHNILGLLLGHDRRLGGMIPFVPGKNFGAGIDSLYQ